MSSHDLTSDETRQMVNETVELLKRQTGVYERRRKPLTDEQVRRRLELIRRQAESQRGR